MQLGFFIQQSAFKGYPGVRFTHIRQLSRGARWCTPHMLSCSLVQTIGSSKIYFRVFFFIEALSYQMCTLGHTLYRSYGIKWMIFHE